MTKPWEEEWEQDEHDPNWVIATVGGRREVAARLGRMTEQPNPKDIARARLASKAPKMANLLARILDEHGAYLPHTAGDIEDLLREAGVLE